MDHQNFFVYQRKALQPLLAWGVGSSLAGVFLMLFPGYWRQVGLQATAWGVIDVMLAMVGRRRALLKAEQLAHGAIDEHKVTHEAEQFRNLLAFNAGLDVVYIVVGLVVAARWHDRPDRRGLGHGIAAQGAFLLSFDALLARNIDRRWLDQPAQAADEGLG